MTLQQFARPVFYYGSGKVQSTELQSTKFLVLSVSRLFYPLKKVLRMQNVANTLLCTGQLHPVSGDIKFPTNLDPSSNGLHSQCEDSGGQSHRLPDQPDPRHLADHQCT